MASFQGHKTVIEPNIKPVNTEIVWYLYRLKTHDKKGEKAIKATPAKKAPKVSAKKKAVKATATDQVLKIINRLKKGADTATLMKKTGFDQKKVRNILNRTFKQGKIKRADKGIYVGA